jgi:IS605 OrfB family transposase
MRIRAIRTVAQAYKRDRENRPVFRTRGAMAYDERIMNFARPERISLLTPAGRIAVPFRFGGIQEARLDRARGQADRLYRNGAFYLACTGDTPKPAPNEASAYLGVHLGISTIAVTSDGEIVNQARRAMVCAHVNTARARYERLRAKLQKEGTKSAKQLLKKRGGRERRLGEDVNHRIRNQLGALAKDARRGLALGDLTNMRSRITVRGKRQRRVPHSWVFGQPRPFTIYEAQMAGARVALVNPAYMSQTCSRYGHCKRSNRRSQSRFLCVSRTFSALADRERCGKPPQGACHTAAHGAPRR